MLRIILVVLILVVIVGGGIFFFLQQQPQDTGQPGDDAGLSQQDVDVAVNATLTAIATAAGEQPTQEVIQFVEVVVAIQDIPRGVVIRPDMVEISFVPEDVAPVRAITDPAEVIGQIARTDIFREQVVLDSLVVPDLSQIGSIGSDAAALLEPGRVAVSLPIDAVTSVAYALQPGDRVDVIVSMLFVNVDRQFQTLLPNTLRFVNLATAATNEEGQSSGVILEFSESAEGDLQSRNLLLLSIDEETNEVRSEQQVPITSIIVPSEQQRPRLATQRTVTDAVVLYLGEFPRDGRIFRQEEEATAVPTATPTLDPALAGATPSGPPTVTPLPPRPQLVTLAVTPQDAVVLTYMAEAGLPITFALRSARATGLPPTDPVTLEYLLQRFNIQVPSTFDFAVEPAIRSIRELSLGNRIELNPQPTAAATEDPNADQNN
jgi:pilus assembly protein CpaB